MTIAVLLGAWGNRGAIRAVSLSDHEQRFERLSEVHLFDARMPESDLRSVEVEWARKRGGDLVLKFRGVDTISAAEQLSGSEVRVPLSGRLPLPEGEYYQSDLVGCEVVERVSGRVVGRVQGWREFGGPALLEVEGPGGEEVLIPFARSICVGIDLDAKRIEVDLPAGLTELGG